MRNLVLLGRLAFPCCALPARFLGVCCASNSTWLSRLCHKILLVFIGNIETYAEDIKRAPSALARAKSAHRPTFAVPPCFTAALRHRPLRVLTHPNSVTGVPGGCYFRSGERFTTTAHEGASDCP